MRNIYSFIVLLIAILSTGQQALAQCDPILKADSSQQLFNGQVRASARIGNTIYLGGTFTGVSKNTGSFAAVEANITGTPYNMPIPNSITNCFISDGAGGWIIGGNFSAVGSAIRNRLARINASGQVTTWDPNANGNVTSLFLNGSTLYVGGTFSIIGGQPRNNLAAFDMLTGNITTWNPNSTGVVNTITVGGTNVYVGGSFSVVGGQSRSNIAAIDATTGLATAWNPGTNGVVNEIVINGSVAYFGGSFTTAAGVARNNLAAVSTTTAVASSWNPASNSVVHTIVLNGSNLLIGGTFSVIGSQSRVGIGEVDANIGNATAFNLALPTNSGIYAIKKSGSDIYIGGNFTATSGNAYIAKVSLLTNSFYAWQANTNGLVNNIDLDGNKLYVSGSFTQITRGRQNLAAIDAVSDTLLPWNPGANNTVNALTAGGGKLYVGGAFTTLAGATRNRIGSFDATGTLESWNPNMNNMVYAIAYDAGSVYAGGAFTQVGTTARNYLAAIDGSTGSLVSAWNPAPNNAVQTLLASGSDLYLGGTFTTVSSTTRNRIASVGLSSGTLSGWNPDADGVVFTLATSGTNIYVGGAFNNIGGQFRPRLAAITTLNGTATTWNPNAQSSVATIAINGNDVFAGGSFTNIGGQPRANLAVVDIGTGNATLWSPSPNASVAHVAVYGDRLIVGGAFTTTSGQSLIQYTAQYTLSKIQPIVTIVGNTTVCSATPTTYTAITTVVGASYQWKKNNVNVGTNSSTYTVAPVNADAIQCVITVPIGSCYTASTAASNTLNITVTSSTTPTASITGSTPVCQGSANTYTATTNITGAFYQWKVNGVNVGNNAATFTYTPANADLLNCVITVPVNGCFSAQTVTSNTITVVVNAPAVPTATITTPNTTVCSGFPVTFTATTNITGGTYQWKVNGGNVSTSTNYTTSSLTNNAVVTCVITAPTGACFTAGSITSNSITMTVTNSITPTAAIAGNATPCNGSLTTYTATTNVVSPTYQWKLNGTNVGTNSDTYAFSPTTANSLACVITTPTGTCYTTPTATSNTITITPQANVVPTISITGSNNLCAGTSGTYAATTNITGGTYQWKVNNTNAGTNSATFSYVPAGNDVVTCTITVPTGCYTVPSQVSNNFVVTVNNPILPTVSIVASATNICLGTVVTYTATTNIVNATYQWKNGTTNIGTNSNVLNYAPVGGTISCEITVPSGGCYLSNSSFSNIITMNVKATYTPTISLTANENPICAGKEATFAALTGGTPTAGTVAYTVNGNPLPVPYVPNNGDVVTATLTPPVDPNVCYTVPTATDVVTMVVTPPAVPTATIAPSATSVCEGASVTYTATTNVVNGTYQWKVNGQTQGNNAPTFTYVPAVNDIVWCVVIVPTDACYSLPQVTSTISILTITAPAQHVFDIAAPPIAAVGSQVTVYANIQNTITAYNVEWKNKGVPIATTTSSSVTYTKGAGIDTITATITPADACFAATTASAIYVHGVATAVNDVARQSISVYPNPFTDRVNMKGLSVGDQVEVYDVAGKRLGLQYTADREMAEHTMMISELPGGAYMLRITDKKGNKKANIALRKL